jgi:hypothetical protein
LAERQLDMAVVDYPQLRLTEMVLLEVVEV